MDRPFPFSRSKIVLADSQIVGTILVIPIGSAAIDGVHEANINTTNTIR
jgi:hypothetical protein